MRNLVVRGALALVLVACTDGVILGGVLPSEAPPIAPTHDDASATSFDAGTVDANTPDAIADAAVDALPSGILDPTFATGGILTRTGTAGANIGASPFDVAKSIAIDSEGRIVIAGESSTGSTSGPDVGLERAVVWRVIPTGSFDPAFGGANGAWVAPELKGDTLALGLVVANGAPRLAGVFARSDGIAFAAMWGLTNIGALDPTFGNGGTLIAPSALGGGSDLTYALAAAGTDLITAGSSRERNDAGGGIGVLTRRQNATGAPSATFGSPNGWVSALSTGGDSLSVDVGNAVTVDSEGRVIVAGQSTDPGGRRIVALWRYLASGAADTTFGNGGAVTFKGIAGNSTSTGLDIAKAVAIDSQGRIVVGGWSEDLVGQADGFVGRLAANGAIDSTFGTNGFTVFTYPTDGSYAEVNALAIDSHHRIVAAGSVRDAKTAYASAWRLAPNGALDATFGDAGAFEVGNSVGGTPSALGDSVYGVAIDAQDRAVLVGTAGGYNDGSFAPGTPLYLGIWRLTP